MKTSNSKENLCDTCIKRINFPECSPHDMKFGNGLGNDNIIKCDNWDNKDRIKLEEGKYEIIYTPNPFELKALRNGEEWRDLTGDKLVLSLVHKIQELEEINKNAEYIKSWMDVPRKEVIWFALQMEKVLKDNDHKGTWDGCNISYLKDRLEEESEELTDTLKIRVALMAAGINIDKVVIKEAVDVANFAMMIADIINKEREEVK